MRKSIPLIFVIALLIGACTNDKQSTGDVKIVTVEDSVFYALGVDIGNNILKSGLEEVNAQIIAKGIDDVYNDANWMESTDAQLLLRNYFTSLRTKKTEKNLKEAQEFLENNKDKEGVKQTDSGLQYKIIKEGDGPIPELTDMVKVNYTGTLVDGREFDASKENPAQFRVNGVIKGWTEALQMMPVGSKWTLFVPPDIAYGENPRPGGIIEPNHMLVFDIELVEIVNEK
ncbi:MAG: FKBP-type peptidyl-prolyl cis-trans isomerase [Bacteroidales bacterium]|nr:FKBP-type peptidyl-prolyl cis-trans isomerase [Bacteroidales bacterium]